MCDMISEVTGIPNLQPDLSLFGGGLHETSNGGRLGVHVDFNRHQNGLYRRVNVLLFLNPAWSPKWGGNLEMWEGPGTGNCKMIAPLMGRMVIFPTTDKSWHGHPRPLNAPAGITRKSIAWYFYHPEPPAGYRDDHDTVYANSAIEQRQLEAFAANGYGGSGPHLTSSHGLLILKRR